MSYVLVTGASGFIGLPLCKALSQLQHHVTAVLRNTEEGPWHDYVKCDLGEQTIRPSTLKGIDTVIHLAGIAHRNDKDEEQYQRINTDATVELARAAARAGVKQFIFISSVNAAADPKEHCVDESWDGYPDDAYGKSKRDAEEQLLAIGAEYPMHVCILRPSLVYGVGVKGNLARMIRAIQTHRFPPVPEFHNRRSMISSDDLISAIIACMQKMNAARGKLYIVTDGVAYSTREMYIAIKQALGKPVPRWYLPCWVLRSLAYLGDIINKSTGITLPLNTSVYRRLANSACYKSDRIRTELGWCSTKTFNDILPAIIKAMKAMNE
jgi:nucleoside-diphosphate-sugar epimerase